MKSPAFQFYPDNFVSGAPAFMKPIETHVYVWLMCLEWTRSGFANDESELAQWCRVSVARFRKAWPKVSACFVERDGKYYHPRLDAEREKQRAYSDRMSENGRKGGRPKADVMPRLSRGIAERKHSVSISNSVTTTTTDRGQNTATWLTPVALAYEQRKGAGTFPFPKFGKLLKPLHDAGHSGEEIGLRLGRYIDWLDDPKYLSLARFRETFDDYAESEPLAFRQLAGYPAVVDEFGCMTAYGERVTRPAGLKLA